METPLELCECRVAQRNPVNEYKAHGTKEMCSCVFMFVHVCSWKNKSSPVKGVRREAGIEFYGPGSGVTFYDIQWTWFLSDRLLSKHAQAQNQEKSPDMDTSRLTNSLTEKGKDCWKCAQLHTCFDFKQ